MIDTTSVDKLNNIGSNPGHDKHLDLVSILAKKRRYKLSRILRNITRNKNLGISRVKNLFPKNKKVVLKPEMKKTSAKNVGKFTSHDVETGHGTTLAWVN